jgi:hypothetical protein
MADCAHCFCGRKAVYLVQTADGGYWPRCYRHSEAPEVRDGSASVTQPPDTPRT